MFYFPTGKKANIFEANAEGAPRREVGRIAVTHTERQFPTPERESVKPQEEEVSDRDKNQDIKGTRMNEDIKQTLLTVLLEEE